MAENKNDIRIIETKTQQVAFLMPANLRCGQCLHSAAMEFPARLDSMEVGTFFRCINRECDRYDALYFAAGVRIPITPVSDIPRTNKQLDTVDVERLNG